MSEISFNQLVYGLVRNIPSGKVLSYGRVAYLLDVPNGARAVGWALSALKDSETGISGVPWHRVVNAQGRVSIKGSPDAAMEQRIRLEAEGIEFDKYDTLDMTRYLWEPALPEIETILVQLRGQDAPD
ncbi:MAG: MGMT family protein [Anaerolineae bacterium]|nr:MGMT family protein [Anaerolineae bacterium]